jgi:two-component system NtrC family sensor kinase
MKRQVELTLAVDGLPAMAPVDPNQVEQAIGNLVMNAIQAISGQGLVTIRVQPVRKRPPVDIGGEETDQVAITIEDNGTGIAPKDLAHIFEPFFTTQSAGEGTGLGLSITQEIIRDHGGWIEVESEPWKGSRFTVVLPTAHRPEMGAKV